MSDHDAAATGRDFGPDELNDAITKSRALLPTAVDALCEVVAEVTGKQANREIVEFVGSFWLMHACDQEIYGQSDSVRRLIVKANASGEASRNRRSEVISFVGSSSAPVRIVDPYFKTSFSKEILGALKARRNLCWQSVPPTREKLYDVQRTSRVSTALAFARIDGEKTLRQSIALAAPIELVEQHHDLVAWSEEVSDPRAQILYSANAHQASIRFRYLLVQQRLRGSKIVFHQHGGGYGIDEQHPGEFHDTLLGDVFYSWGWRRPDLGAKVRPLPTASPARHKGLTGRHYLLMSLPITAHFYRLQAFVLPGHVAKSLSQTEIFLANLSSDVELHIRASGYVEYPTRAKNAFRGKLAMDSLKEPGVIAASRSRLVIHNYLGTSWLETLAMNVPTVCFYDPAIYRTREAARPFIDALQRVGVIHHSGADAARFVNDLKGDPSSWWRQPEVQEAREKFVARYANFTDNWLPGWIEEFERLLKE